MEAIFGVIHQLIVTDSQLEILIEAMRHNCETAGEIHLLQYLQHTKRSAELRKQASTDELDLDEIPF